MAEREFHITPYAKSVKRGSVKFNLDNLGQDTHNLVVKGPHGFKAQEAGRKGTGDLKKNTGELIDADPLEI